MRKQLGKSRLNYEESQTVLCEVETILNNRPLTYYYSDNTEQCLTPNHLLFGRTIKLFDPEPTDITHDINVHCKKISNIINHFWEGWRREYLKVMKRADPCKHRQAVKSTQCEKKLFNFHLHSSKLEKTVEKHAISTNQKMAASMENLLVRLLL